MKKISLLFLLALSFGAVACTAPEATDSSGGNGVVADTAVSTTNNQVEIDTAVSTTETEPDRDTPRLNEAYSDALPVMMQLAIGTIRLEATELAVDETLAAEILPLWQAAQSLSNSDTAASVEITAVLNQIQDSMTPEQVTAIADLALTKDSLTELMESGAITFGRGTGQGQGQNNGGEGGFTPPAGFVPGQGGGPGGGGAGGGLGGPGTGNLSEDDIATRQAQFASGEGLAEVQDQALVGAVVRLLQTKSGAALPNQRVIADTVIASVSQELGLTVEALQAQLTDGSSLVAIIEANGGEVTAVREVVLSALNELENGDALAVEQIVNSWFSE